MQRRLVLGDIHGAYKALIQVFERAKFDYEQDLLIFLGDVVDGWPETKACIEELLKVKHLIALLGNHDQWAWDWMKDGWQEEIWTRQGGSETLRSYDNTPVPAHLEYFEKLKPYYLTADNKLFVHGGIDPQKELEDQELMTLTWDRALLSEAYKRSQTLGVSEPITDYDEVYIGHSSTEQFSTEPIQLCELWCLDQGAGWSGKLSLMDVDSKDFWQSDVVKTLYPGEKGRF